MKKVLRLGYIVLLVLFVISGSALASTTVNLIATNDMHGVLEASDTAVGVAQVSAIKNSTENALLIDSGDATQGTTLATINEGNDVIRLMNAAGYDCMVAGNHEFDYGSDQLLRNAQTANFPILSANAVTSSGTLLPATHIITKADKRIGFIGITTSTTNTSTNPALRPGVTFSDEIDACKKAIASLNGQVDTIVLLTHLGDDPKVVPVTSGQLLDGLDSSELSQISAVLDGHSHTIESEPYVKNGFSIPVIQDQTQLTHVGKVAITFNDDGSVSAQEQVMDYDTANQYPITDAGQTAKDDTQHIINNVNNEQSAITERVIGNTKSPLWGGYIYWDYAEPRIVETSFGDLVSDAYRNAAKSYANEHALQGTVLGVVNGGGIGNSIDPGEITYGEILNVFNHGNIAVVIQSTPAELYQVLENGLRTTGQNSNGMLEREDVSGSFIQCSGFTYSYNPSGAAGSKVTSVQTSDGTNLSRTDTTTPLIIGTQNYVQTFFKDSKQLSLLDAEDQTISNYISSKNGIINYPTNGERISISDDKSPDTYDVTIPVYEGTADNLAPANTTVQLSIDSGAYQEVQTDSGSNLKLTLDKGPHTLILKNGSKPVYVNNYSGAGTSFTRPGYYGLSFLINEIKPVPATDINVSSDSVDLSPQSGNNTQTVTASVSPANTTDQISWSTNSSNIVSVQADGASATITGITEGRAVVTVTCGKISKDITVIVSNDPIVASDFYITDTSPDFFTVYAKDVHSNRALPSSVNVKQVSIFTWSSPTQEDIDCKVAQKVEGTAGDYTYTFPVNDNGANNYYINADDINIHVYASSEADSNGNMIGIMNYNYANQNSMPTGLGVTAYCANIGFIKPTFNNNAIAGAPDLSQPLEGIRIGTPYPDVNLVYSVHVQDIGWMPSENSGSYAGTMGLNKSIEAVKIELTGSNAGNYTLTYQTTAVDNSVSEVCTNGQEAGTTGQALPLKGIQVSLVENTPAP